MMFEREHSFAVVAFGAVSLSACDGASTAAPPDPAAFEAYRATVACASSSVGAVALLAGEGKDTSLYEDAAMRHTQTAVDDGASLGKSRSDVMVDIKANYGEVEGNDEAIAAMEADLAAARDCLPRLD